MKHNIDWDAVFQDWKASGLSKNRYFLSGRFEKFVVGGISPCHSTLLRHLREIEKSHAAAPQEACAMAVPAEKEDTAVAVHRLTQADIQKVTARSRTVAVSRSAKTRSPVLRSPMPIKLSFANGASLKFFTESPENFAFQALALGGRFS